MIILKPIGLVNAITTGSIRDFELNRIPDVTDFTLIATFGI